MVLPSMAPVLRRRLFFSRQAGEAVAELGNPVGIGVLREDGPGVSGVTGCCFRYSTCSDEGAVVFFSKHRDEEHGISGSCGSFPFIEESALSLDMIGGLLVCTKSSCRSLTEGEAFLDVSSAAKVSERSVKLRLVGKLLYINSLS